MINEIKLLHQNIFSWIKRFQLYRRLLFLLEGLCLQGIVVIISLISYCFIDNFLFEYKRLFFWIFFSLNITSLAFIIIQMLFKGKSFITLAEYIESRIPIPDNKLVSSLDFYKNFDLYTNVYGYSSLFMQLSMKHADELLSKTNPSKILDFGNLRKKFYSLSLFLGPFLLWIAIFPYQLAITYNNFYRFSTMNYLHDRTIIRILPHKKYVNINSSQSINIFIYGKIPQDITIYTSVKSDVYYPLEKIIVPKKGEVEYTFKNIQMNMSFYAAAAASARSNIGTIIINQEPVISNINLTCNYPLYTELKPKIIDNVSGNIKALPGTRVTIKAAADRALENAEIVFDSGRTILKILDSTEISGDVMVAKPDNYSFAITSKEGIKNSNPVKYTIEVEKDTIPKVEIVNPGRDIKIPQDMKINLSISVTDDYGIKKIRLKYKIISQSQEKTIDLIKFTSAKTTVLYNYIWDLTDEKLFPGQVIQYYAESWDNDTVNGPKKGISQIFSLTFPSLFEIYMETELEQGKEIDELKEVQDESKNLETRIENTRKNIEDENKTDWNKENEIKQIKEMHKEVMEKDKDIQNKMEKNVDELKKNALVQQPLVEKVMEIQKLMNDIMTEEMKNTLQKLNESIKEINLDEKKKALMDAEFNQEKFIQKLDRTIELLKRVRNERRLEVMAKQAQQLAERQKELQKTLEKINKKGKENISKAEMNDLIVKQEQDQKEINDLQENIMELAKDFNKENPNISKKLQDIGNKIKNSEIAEKMQELKANLKNEKFDQSSKNANDTQKQMSDTAEQLDQLIKEMQRNVNEEILRMIQTIIYNGLFLSNEQEKILLDIQTKSRQDKNLTLAEENVLDEFAIKEMHLSEGVNNLAQTLVAISKISPVIKPELPFRLQDLSKKMSSLKINIGENDLFTAIPLIHENLTELNRIIAEFLETSNDLKKKMSQAGSEDMFSQLDKMSKQQQGINDMTEMMQNEMQKQGELSSEQQELLEKMSYEQNKLREMLEQLNDQYNKMEGMMGKLDDIKDLMENVAQELKKKALNSELNRKQKRILNRLLDTQKSLKTKEEFDKERKADKAKFFEKINSPEELSKELTNKEKKDFQDKIDIQLDRIPLEYRDLTEKYFKTLSEMVW
ncbi:hypothetical protein HY745_14600 [Candidatus Desantisbacteria bacterium]|nr:hypothetical protein [Candidatus Desantisbacteria bacterium]